MSTPIPPPLRAAAGLAAIAIDTVRKIPGQLVGLPVLTVSAALQVSLKAQQRYAELVARGDEVLGQVRGVQEAPEWARFDDEPAPAARPRSAFDAAPEPGRLDEDLLDELAAELGGGESEAGLLADAEAGLDGGPVLEPDGVAATEAEVGGLDVGEVPLDGTAPGVDLAAGGITGGRADPPAGWEPGSGTEPGVDLPAGGMTGLSADAEAVEHALAGSTGAPAGAGTEPVVDEAPADPTAGLDGYLAIEPPVARYDDLSIPQLRGRLRSLSEAQIEQLVAYERATAARPPYLTMLENRLVTLRSR